MRGCLIDMKSKTCHCVLLKGPMGILCDIYYIKAVGKFTKLLEG